MKLNVFIIYYIRTVVYENVIKKFGVYFEYIILDIIIVDLIWLKLLV